MDSSWEDFLHWSLSENHVLFSGLRINTFPNFLLAVFLTIAICLSERLLTLALSKQWCPFPSVRRSRLWNAMWRTSLYWIVTVLRLTYMLITMSYHVGLILTAAIALASGQFLIELVDTPAYPSRQSPTRDVYMHEPLLRGDDRSLTPQSSVVTRPRSKSKPDGIFIHPTHSNIARADAAALELGICGDTERVKGNSYPPDRESWEHGKGPDLARALMGGNAKRYSSQTSPPFSIGDEDSD